MLPKNLLTYREKEVLRIIAAADLAIEVNGRDVSIQSDILAWSEINYIPRASVIHLSDLGLLAPVSNTNTTKTYRLARPPREGISNGK